MIANKTQQRDGRSDLFDISLYVMRLLCLATIAMASFNSDVGASENSKELSSVATNLTSTPTTAPSLRGPATTEAAGVQDPIHGSAPKRPTFRNDFIFIEMIRLVFSGTGQNAGFPNKVYGLLESFLTRATREVKAMDGSDWSFELSSTLKPMEFENTTYMDFRLKHTARTVISTIFSQRHLREFIAQNSHLVLVADCWTSSNCQNGSAQEISKMSVLEKNVSLFSAVVVLCSLCLVVMVTGMTCSYLRRMKSSKKAASKPKTTPGESQRAAANHNSAGDAQPSRDGQTEGTFFRSCPFGEEEEGEGDLHGTWDIPLDTTPEGQGPVVVVMDQDTKL